MCLCMVYNMYIYNANVAYDDTHHEEFTDMYETNKRITAKLA